MTKTRTKTERNAWLALQVLLPYGDAGLNVGFIGSQLWGRMHRHPQHYARSAGKLLKWMKDRDLVEWALGRGFSKWRVRPGWLNRARALGLEPNT